MLFWLCTLDFTTGQTCRSEAEMHTGDKFRVDETDAIGIT